MSRLKSFWNNKYIFSGSLILFAITLLGLVGFFFHPYNPTASFASNLPPSRIHILGTNFFGNDIWSQFLVGILPTIEIGLAGALLGLIVALFVGLVSGYARGLKNEILTFFINVFLLIPGLPLAIVISSDLQASHANLGNLALILVITITGWATGARTIRSQVLSLSNRDYITFIKHTGESHLNIIFREILPSLLSYVGYIFTNLVVFSIILETSLLFLGLGNEAIISLGSILYYANSYSAILLGEWWWFIPPGLTIAFLGVGFGLISLGLDVIANPTLRVFKKAKGSEKKNSNKILKVGEEM